MPVQKTITGRFDDDDAARLTVACRLFYARSGKFPSSDQIRHWVEVGVCGARLRAVKVGGAWRSTEVAVDQFLEARAKGRRSARRLKAVPA